MAVLVFICLVVAAVLFAIGTKVVHPNWNLMAAGLFFLTLAFLLPATQNL